MVTPAATRSGRSRTTYSFVVADGTRIRRPSPVGTASTYSSEKSNRDARGAFAATNVSHQWPPLRPVQAGVAYTMAKIAHTVPGNWHALVCCRAGFRSLRALIRHLQQCRARITGNQSRSTKEYSYSSKKALVKHQEVYV